MDAEYKYIEEIAYVVERAIKEGSIPQYIKNDFGDKKSIDELVSDIIVSDEQFNKLTIEGNVSSYSTDDEHNYIAEQTGYATEIIETVVWFYECYKMANSYIIYCGNCNKCGHDELYIREGNDGLYSSIVECGKCKEKYTFEQMEEDDPFEYDLSEQLPLQRKEAKALKDVNETNVSYIIKAATGYRKGIWRKIQISAAATLHDLGLAILDAFEFDYDHLYAFYMDDKLRTRRGIPTFYSPRFGYKAESAALEMLENFSFIPKQRFLFLYDFGHEWHFTMTFEKEINEVTPKAFVIQSRGESPPQYREYWDDEDEGYEEDEDVDEVE